MPTCVRIRRERMNEAYERIAAGMRWQKLGTTAFTKMYATTSSFFLFLSLFLAFFLSFSFSLSEELERSKRDAMFNSSLAIFSERSRNEQPRRTTITTHVRVNFLPLPYVRLSRVINHRETFKFDWEGVSCYLSVVIVLRCSNWNGHHRRRRYRHAFFSFLFFFFFFQRPLSIEN